MRHLAPVALLLLAGCASNASVAIPSKIERPSARLMTPPATLPMVGTGADLYETNVVCRAQYGHEAGKLRGLQGYVGTILKK